MAGPPMPNPEADPLTPAGLPLPLRIRAPHPDRAPLPPAAEVGVGGGRVVRTLRGVPYAESDGGRPLELDLWLPADPGPAPLVLYVHGGGWRRGRRDDMGLLTRAWVPGPLARIAATGLAVAAVFLFGQGVFSELFQNTCDSISQNMGGC